MRGWCCRCVHGPPHQALPLFKERTLSFIDFELLYQFLLALLWRKNSTHIAARWLRAWAGARINDGITAPRHQTKPRPRLERYGRGHQEGPNFYLNMNNSFKSRSSILFSKKRKLLLNWTCPANRFILEVWICISVVPFLGQRIYRSHEFVYVTGKTFSFP